MPHYRHKSPSASRCFSNVHHAASSSKGKHLQTLTWEGMNHSPDFVKGSIRPAVFSRLDGWHAVKHLQKQLLVHRSFLQLLEANLQNVLFFWNPLISPSQVVPPQIYPNPSTAHLSGCRAVHFHWCLIHPRKPNMLWTLTSPHRKPDSFSVSLARPPCSCSVPKSNIK